MAANTQPIFALTPQLHVVQFSTANTNRDGTTGTYATGPTIGSNGGMLIAFILHATVTTTAGMVRIFINNKLFREIPIPAITVSGTVPGFSTIVRPLGGGLVLPASAAITFNTNNAETFNMHTSYGDY